MTEVPAEVIEAALATIPGTQILRQRVIDIRIRDGWDLDGTATRKALIEIVAPAIWDAALESHANVCPL